MRNRQSIFHQPQGRLMSGVALASSYARRLVDGEARRARTSMKTAIVPVARRLKAPPGAIWSLLFRPPKKVSDDLMSSLGEAVRREIELEIGALNVELAAVRSGNRHLDSGAITEVEEDLARLRAILRGAAR